MGRELTSDQIALLFDMGPAVKTAEEFAGALKKVSVQAEEDERTLRKLDDTSAQLSRTLGDQTVKVALPTPACRK